MSGILRIAAINSILMCLWPDSGTAQALNYCQQRKNIDLAISAGTDIVQQNPGNGAAYRLHGDAYKAKGAYGRAIVIP